MISEELGAYTLELPYKGNEISMFVLLPPFSTARSMQSPSNAPPQDGVRQLVERIATRKGAQELREILDFGMSREVEVSFQKDPRIVMDPTREKFSRYK